MVDFWSIQINRNCTRPNDFITTTRSIIIGCSFFLLALVNLVSHSVLVTIILYNWKATFHQFFVYRLILSMSFMTILNMLGHFSMTIPCSITGCLNWPAWLIQFLTCFYRTMEYGFLVSITFIAVDRFFSFYFQYYGEKFIQKIYTLVILWILAFMTQFVLFIFGCPKMFNPITIGIDPCVDCQILGVSWNTTARTLIYNLPYPMFVLYLLIIIKIVALRYNVYHATRTFSKNDQVLAIQFLILCGIQYALSYLENYCKEGPDNYYGLLIMSVPFLVQISHALALLLTNLLIRKALMQFIFHRRSNSKVFAMAIGNPPSKQNLVNSFKPRVLVKVTQRRWNIWKAGGK